MITLILTAVAAPALADPATFDLSYRLHEDPTDPNSPVTIAIRLSLEQAASDGEAVGWEIVEARFREIGEGGQPDGTWTATLPVVSTPHGLWWVEHADAQAPQLGEFVSPPPLSGEAPADDPGAPSLLYDMEAGAYTTPPEGDPWNVTTALTYTFTVAGEQKPKGKGKDKPTEVGGGDDRKL
jgi:hypothetical protein